MKQDLRNLLVEYCEASKFSLISKCSWYTVRESDGGFFGMHLHPDGDAKVLAVAHIDHLCSGKVHHCNRKTIISSALDDRAGVFAAFELLGEYGIKADIVLTDFEETGQSTMRMMGQGMLKKYNWIVQLDRRGTDVVTYGFGEMDEVLADYWEVGHGAFSDISKLEEVSPISAFNMGVGYHGEHGEDCFLSFRELDRQMKTLGKFYADHHDTIFERECLDMEIRDADAYWDAKYKKYTPTVGAPKLVQGKVADITPPPDDFCDMCSRETEDLYDYDGLWCCETCWDILDYHSKEDIPNEDELVVTSDDVIHLPGTHLCEACGVDTGGASYFEKTLNEWQCWDCFSVIGGSN